MTQNIDTFYGLHIDLISEIDQIAYARLRKSLTAQIAALPDPYQREIEVYIHEVDFEIKDVMWGFSLDARLNDLNIAVEIHDTARQKNLMWFMNPQIGDVRYAPAIPVEPHKYRIIYSLSGSYCEKNKKFTEYVAAIVKNNCPPKLRTITINATAKPTDGYRRKMINLPPVATTKISFPLTHKVQLDLA